MKPNRFFAVRSFLKFHAESANSYFPIQKEETETADVYKTKMKMFSNPTLFCNITNQNLKGMLGERFHPKRFSTLGN